VSVGRRIVLSEEDFAESAPARPEAAAATAAVGSSPAPSASAEQPPSLLRVEQHPRRVVASPPVPATATVAPALPPAVSPRVGGWGFAIFFFGLIGGAIGYFALKGSDPRRADHVLKWGLIATAISIGAWVLLWVIVLAIVAHSASGSAFGAAGGWL
jgi:hypothetical protein